MTRNDWPVPGGYPAQENLTVEMFGLISDQVSKERK